MNYEKLIAFVPQTGGLFLEAGANDGIFHSYTYRLEKERNWTGVLVEPAPKAFSACKLNRPRSIVLNCALTDENVDTLTGDFDGHPMGSVGGTRLNRSAAITVKAMSLTKIFEQRLQGRTVDLMSIDVENYELNALRSLDFARFRPRFILVEVYKGSFWDVSNLLLSRHYALLSNITDFNLTNNPSWDGTHNDYLFTDLRPPAPGKS